MYWTARLIALISAAALVVAGCGSGSSSTTSSSSGGSKPQSNEVDPSAEEKSPPGDIPDDTQFVRFSVPGGSFSVKIPEGWARTANGSRVTFTSNLNSVAIEHQPATVALTAAGVQAKDVQTLAHALQGFHLQSVRAIKRSGQRAIRVTYLAKSKPDPVTGKSVTDAVERYLFARNGKQAILTLAGPNGADNVDAWRTISESLKWGQ